MHLLKLPFISLILATICVSPGFAGPNLIINGDFEDNLNNWTLGNGFTGVNVASISTDTPSGFGSSVDLDINEVLGLPWLIQDVPVTVGDLLTFSADVREVRQFIPPGTNPSYPDGVDAWIAAQVWMLPNSESGTILSYAFAFYSNSAWETQGFDIEVPTGATIARVLFTPQDPDFGVGTGRYRIDNVSLSAAGGLVGDYNKNDSVDAADYVVWRHTLGSTTNLDADGDGSGTVDAPDLGVWRGNFGATSTATGGELSSASIPEPSTLMLLGLISPLTLLSPRSR